MILAVLLLTPYKSNNGLDDFKKSVIKCGYQVVLLWFNMNLFHHFSRLHLHHYTSTHPSFFFFSPASWCWCFTRSGKQNRFWKTLIKHQGYHNSVLFSHSCVVLLPPPSFHKCLSQFKELLSQVEESKLVVVLGACLCSSLPGSQKVWKVLELGASVGMWPKVEESCPNL